MLNFILALIIFIANLFPAPKPKSIGQQESDSEQGFENTGAKPDAIKGIVSKSSTTMLTGCETATQVPSGSHSPSKTANEGSARARQLDGYEQDNSGSLDLMPRVRKARNHVPLEDIENTLQDIGGRHEERLRTEEAAHRQTREELTRNEEWCERLADENIRLQAQDDEAGRESTRLQRRLDDAEDENFNLDIALSNAEERIRGLKHDLEAYLSENERLRNEGADLSADINYYGQMGTDLYMCLKKAEEVLHPSDRGFAEYLRLMRDVARLFSVPVEARDEGPNVYDDVVRFEEVGDVDCTEGDRNDQDVGGQLVIGTNQISRARTPANVTGIAQAKAHTTTLKDDDEEHTCPNRTMRPDTARGSIFAGSAEKVPSNPAEIEREITMMAVEMLG